jgi:hypothetical protein
MFEDFRKQTDESSLASLPPEEEDLRAELVINEPEQHFLGMTAVQRFALMLLLFVMIAILGVLFLLVTDTVVPPAFG